MNAPRTGRDDSLSPFDDLFPNADEQALGQPIPADDGAWSNAHKSVRRSLDRRTSTDATGARRVKRGRRRLSPTDARNLTHELAGWYLATEVAADRRLTPGDVRVLAIMVRAANKAGGRHTDIAVKTIANRAAVSDRQVQLTVTKLSQHPFNLVRRTFRPLRPGMNDTNVYEIAARCFRGGAEVKRSASQETASPASDAAPARGEKLCGVKNKPILDIYTSTPTRPAVRKRSTGCRKRTATGSCRDRSGPPDPVFEVARPRTAPIPNISPDDAGLIKRALAVIRPDRALPDDPVEIVRAVDRLRLEYIPGFDESAWPMLAARHGTRAYLAVVETLLMASVRAGTDRVIQSLPAYLGGILWKPRGQVNPGHTVSEILRLYADQLEPRRAA
ncbi:MAG: hypothetical protein RIC16_04095 [Rhodospirillales bacterium]